VIVLTGVSYWIKKPQEKIVKEPSKDFSIILNFDGKDTQKVNASVEEVERVKSVIDQFEKYKYQKDFVSEIGLLTLPATAEEKGSLDHFLGNDLMSLNNGSPSPRFLNKDKFHLPVGYHIEKIEKKDGVIYASTKELRVLDKTEEGEPSRRFETDSQDLIFEIISTNNGLQISQYYHSKVTSPAIKKYEGFISY
jgi:hypothetical protein